MLESILKVLSMGQNGQPQPDKAMHGTQRDFILKHTIEYMFAEQHKDTILEPFWDYVQECHPLACVEPRVLQIGKI